MDGFMRVGNDLQMAIDKVDGSIGIEVPEREDSQDASLAVAALEGALGGMMR